MTDRAADNGLGSTTTNHQWRATAVALAATAMAAAMAEARAMVAVKVMRTSDNDDKDATTQQLKNADDANDDADGEGSGGWTTRLPGGSGGPYYPHFRMGGAAHGFIRPPPRLAAKTMTIAASTGGPAGSPPRLRARRQAPAATRDARIPA